MTALRSEILKSKRTSSWYLTILGSAVLPVIFMLDACADGLNTENLKDPLNAIINEGFKGINLLILPMYIILICTLLPQIEYRNNTWKQVFTSPHTLAEIFLSKFLHVQLMIILFLILFNLSVAASATGIYFIKPSIGMFNHSMDWSKLISFNVKTYLSIVAVSAIQFLIGLRFKSFIAPIAIGFVLWVIGGILVFEVRSSLANGFPFSYPTMIMFPTFISLVPTLLWNSVGYALFFVLAGYVAFKNRKVKV